MVKEKASVIIKRLKGPAKSTVMSHLIKYAILSGCFNHHSSQMTREHLALIFGKRSKIIITSKLQRFELNNSGGLEIDPTQVCLPKFGKVKSSDTETNEEGRNDQL